MMLRIVTGLVAGLLTLAAALAGAVWWKGFVLFFLAAGSLEWAEMAGVSKPLLFVTLVGSGVLVIYELWAGLPLFLLLPALPILYHQDPALGRDAVWSAAGIVWLSIPAGLMVFVRQDFEFVALAVLMVGTILQDSMALYTGLLFGGDTPFTPELSPNKTWAGFYGGMVGMVLTLLVGGFLMSWPWYLSVAAGFLLGLVGQAGDLSMSALKRRREIDDTGMIFPGHGGILDRTDALIFNVAVFFPMCRLVEAYGLSKVNGSLLLRFVS